MCCLVWSYRFPCPKWSKLHRASLTTHSSMMTMLFAFCRVYLSAFVKKRASSWNAKCTFWKIGTGLIQYVFRLLNSELFIYTIRSKECVWLWHLKCRTVNGLNISFLFSWFEMLKKIFKTSLFQTSLLKLTHMMISDTLLQLQPFSTLSSTAFQTHRSFSMCHLTV